MSGTTIHLRDATVRLDSMPPAGRDIAVCADDEERGAIAARIGLSSVDRLDVALHAVRFRGGFRVTGRLAADVTQASVVTLEPVAQRIDEPIDRVFLPGGEKPFAGPANAEVFVDLEGDDLPDHFEGNEADLSELIIETLALAADLYPREPGATLEATGYESEDSDTSPFEALKALKPKEE